MTEKQIYLTESDFERISVGLRGNWLRDREDVGDLSRLRDELQRALVVKSTEIPSDVVTMNSRVRLRDLDSGDAVVFSLVYPSSAHRSRADAPEMTVSVLAPVGTAILGYRVGDTIEWKVPAGVRRLKVEDVLYQPEATGRYDI
jgi:regulator of nucleoside diphosphate kinase